mmetsp:Transcript_25271/g.58561  ORF Transcript_25271/g.58561 Transcript_25271/m.58561 type:complete len:221 (+) Transcript_25271:509-1171(+)
MPMGPMGAPGRKPVGGMPYVGKPAGRPGSPPGRGGIPKPSPGYIGILGNPAGNPGPIIGAFPPAGRIPAPPAKLDWSLPPFPLPFPRPPSPLPFPPPSPPSARSPFLLLSDKATFMAFPSASWPFSSSMAFAASSMVDMTTNPTPRFLPVSSSHFRITAMTLPSGSKSSRSFSAVIPSARFLMQIRTPLFPRPSPLASLRFFRSSSKAVFRSARVCARWT